MKQPKKISKKAIVRDILLNGETITYREIMNELYDNSPRDLIYYLRKEGLKISERWEKSKYSRYKIFFMTAKAIQDYYENTI